MSCVSPPDWCDDATHSKTLTEIRDSHLEVARIERGQLKLGDETQ